MKRRYKFTLVGVFGMVALVSALTLALVGSLPVAQVNAATASTIDFEGLGEGSIVSSVSSGSGISGNVVAGSVVVLGSNPSLAGNQAMIFDATCSGGPPSHCTGEDPDLFQLAQGNVLIVSEDGIGSDPDDAAVAGTMLTFDYSGWGTGTVTVNSLDFLDTEELGDIRLFFGGMELAGSPVAIPAIANGAIQNVFVGVSGVEFMKVTLGGSGAIDNIDITAGDDCAVCKGGVTELTLKNNGPEATITVLQKKGEIVFDDVVPANGTFSFIGTGKDNKLGSEITIFVNDVEHVKIHTSCSQPIGPGHVFGDFEVVEGTSKDNGQICPVSDGCDVQPAVSLEFSKKKAKWEITNNGATDLIVESVELSWPEENGQLKKMKMKGDFWTGEVDPPASTTVIGESEFKPGIKRRTIKAGKKRKFELQFKNKPSKDQDDYFIHVVFIGEDGCEIIFTPSSGSVCSTKVQSLTLKYIGAQIVSGITIDFDPDKGPTVSYGPVDLIPNETVLVSAAENGFTIDALPDKEELGAKLAIRWEGFEEVIHTSCSTPFVADAPAPLDDPKGDPSPNFFVVRFVQK